MRHEIDKLGLNYIERFQTNGFSYENPKPSKIASTAVSNVLEKPKGQDKIQCDLCKAVGKMKFVENDWGLKIHKSRCHKDKNNGFVSSIPYAASWIATTIACFLSDYATKNSKISRTMVRRIFSAIGHFIPAFLIIWLSFLDCSNVVLGVIVLTLGVSFDAVNTGAGYLVNINDIAGPYSGILFGVSNTIATLPGILSPYVAGLMTKNHSQEEWQMVFILCSVIYIVGGMISLFLLDANLQPWAKIDKDSISTSDLKKGEKI